MVQLISVIGNEKSDLVRLLEYSGMAVEVIRQDEIKDTDFNRFYAIAILGGTEKDGISLYPEEQVKINEQIKAGKKIFCEFTKGIGCISFLESVSTRYERVVFLADSSIVQGLEQGDILDEQSNTRMELWTTASSEKPLLQYVKNVEGYYKTLNRIDY
jgi:hypothetical protein